MYWIFFSDILLNVSAFRLIFQIRQKAEGRNFLRSENKFKYLNKNPNFSDIFIDITRMRFNVLLG